MRKTNQAKVIVAGVMLLGLGFWGQPIRAGLDPVTIARQAFELRLAGNVDGAVKMLEEGISTQPEAAVLHYELARTRLFLLDIDRMHKESATAVRLEPDNSTFRYFAALAAGYALIDAAHHGDRDRMGDLGRESLEQLEALLDVDPDHHQARYFLVQLSVDMAPDLGLAVDDPEMHVALLEKKDPILGAKARCCLVAEKRQKEIWEGILEAYPEDGRALVEAAEGLIEAGDLDRAELCLDRTIDKDRKHGYALLKLGLAYAMKEDWDRALKLTRKYLELELPPALEAFAIGRMGIIHSRMGDRDQGRRLMDRAREMDPHVWLTVMPPPVEIFTPI